MERAPLVLTVDDDPEMTMLISLLLETEGFEVRTAESVFGAMKQIAEAVPDVILLDIMMPGVDGWRFCRALGESDETARIPVVFVTARGGERDRAAAAAAGAAGFLAKPFGNDELVEEVRRHVSVG